ncbi:CD151 antigen [Acropora cervicornis]|uniref:CD151 antigen n=1 Tax=Acropora cervicornis TaxID=6130 RepID=A0AAD9VCV1_ACRCE|nr:CD151 antigen [Acropora cervicornis]
MLTLIFGCVLVGVGAWSLIKIGDFNDLTEGSYSSASTVMIVAGVLIALISFFGCCGAWKENRCLLIMVDDAFDKGMENIIQQKYGASDMKAITDSVDKLQQQEMCCGWINFTDWYISKFTNGEHKVPVSCCKEQKKGCGMQADTNNNIYKVILGMIFALLLACRIESEGKYV